MPGAVTNAGLAHNVLPLNDLAPEILRIVSRTPAARDRVRELLKSVV
jgi:chemotaxis response regulator CheB